MKYQDYLRSPEWREKRRAVMYRCGGRCEFCGEPAEHVHHVRYPKHFGDEPLDDLVAVCGSCHEKSHGIRGEPAMREMIQRDFEGQAIACFVEETGVWFDYSSICLGLGMIDARGRVEQRTTAALWRRLDDDERRIEQIPDERGNLVNRYFVSKSGAYSVAILSDTPKGNRFRRVLTHEILPSIEATGRYVVPGTAGGLVEELSQAIGGVIQPRIDEVRQIAEGAHERLDRLESVPALCGPSICTVLAREGMHSLTLDTETRKRVGLRCRELCVERGIDPDAYPKVFAGQYAQRQWPLEIVDDALRAMGFIG